MLPNLTQLAQTVRQAALEEIVPRLFGAEVSVKHDGSLVTEADLAMNQRLSTWLQQAWPDIQFLSEEMDIAEQEHLLATADLLWCLDPLDGTSNFAAGFPLFATSLALIQHGRVVLAVTYDPIRDELFTAELGKGAWLNGQALHCHAINFAMKKTVALVDFKRLPEKLRDALANQAPYGSQRNLGTCALEWAWMAANRGHLYLHGGMKIWDLAAGSLILSEAGGEACTLAGEPVFKASMEARSAVISPDKQLFHAWFAYLQDHQ